MINTAAYTMLPGGLCGADAVYERRGTLVIDSSAVAGNAARVRSLTDRAVIAVVKENGYGTGLRREYGLLRAAGITRFAVASAGEALALRRFGHRGLILLLTPEPDAEAAAELIAEDVVLSLTDGFCAEVLRSAGARCGRTPRVHLKLDAGLGRYGFRSEPNSAVWSAMSGLDVEGCYTHFAVHSGAVFSRELRRFYSRVESLFPNGGAGVMLHGAASGTLTASGDLGLDAVRIGSLFLGRGAHCGGFEDAVSMETPIVSVKLLKKGDTVGYGASYRCRRDTIAGVIPVGTADGLSVSPAHAFTIRGTASRDAARFGGSILPFLGAPGTSHAVLDLTDSAASVGDTVTIRVNPLRVHPYMARETR